MKSRRAWICVTALCCLVGTAAWQQSLADPLPQEGQKAFRGPAKGPHGSGGALQIPQGPRPWHLG